MRRRKSKRKYIKEPRKKGRRGGKGSRNMEQEENKEEEERKKSRNWRAKRNIRKEGWGEKLGKRR